MTFITFILGPSCGIYFRLTAYSPEPECQSDSDVSVSRPNERKRKVAVYFEGEPAVAKFEDTMRNILAVPKDEILELEKQKPSRKTR